jgi:hypothetical protein
MLVAGEGPLPKAMADQDSRGLVLDAIFVFGEHAA